MRANDSNLRIKDEKWQDVIEPDDNDRKFVVALARGTVILRCFRPGERYLGNIEISRRTGLPKPTVSRLTYTLTKLGFLAHSPRREQYRLGAGALSLGHTYLSGLDVRDAARPLMQELANDMQAMVSLGTRDRADMVFLELCLGSHMAPTQLKVGARVPRGITPLDRAYLAALSVEERAEVIDMLCRDGKEEQWSISWAGIEQACRDYEKYGFCFSLGDWSKETYSVGVPLAVDDGDRILSFSCSGPIFGMTRDRLVREIGSRLLQMRDQVKRAVRGRAVSG